MNVAILAIAVIALVGIPSAFACTEGLVQHWYSATVQSIVVLQHNSEPDINPGSPFHLPIPLMGSELLSNSFQFDIFADRLNELGYSVGGQPVIGTDHLSSSNFFTDRVRYSTECINGVQQMIGGMLLQPDAMTLVLAYGIANSIWMAPLAIGIGAGVYLTKSKWKKN